MMSIDSSFSGNNIQQENTQTKPEKPIITGLVIGVIAFILTITYFSIAVYQIKTGILDHGVFLFLVEILFSNIIIVILSINGIISCLKYRKRMKTKTFVIGLFLNLSLFLFHIIIWLPSGL